MSVRMMALVWELNLPDSEKLVLLALADCANDEGYCWPSIETLKKKCSKSERTVQNCIRTLCVKGHLTQKPGAHKSYDYVVHPIVRFASDTPAAAAPRKACTPQPLPDTPAAAAPKPLRTIKGSEAKASSLWHALPVGWIPVRQLSPNTQGMVENWPPGALAAELESFRAWAANAKPEKGKGLKKDWDDAFGNWIRSAHRDRYSRIVRMERHRTNPLTELYRATMQPEDTPDGNGAWVSLPPAQHG